MSKSVAGVAAPATPAAAVAAAAPEVFARDAMIAWYRGEFAAANAIIDSLCGHITQISGGGGSEYEAAFTAIHRRRMNWIPVIQMQRFFSIADVAAELKRVAETKAEADAKAAVSPNVDHEARSERSAASCSVRGAASTEVDEEGTEDSSGGDSDQKVHPEEIAGAGEEQNGGMEEAQICGNHEECATRTESIKTRKGFVARELVKGHMVNVVKGLKVYEDIFTDSELFKLSVFINEFRLAGHRGELSGETFIYFNKQMKGNKREIIQLGVPLFQSTKDDSTSNIEPIPAVLETVIDHLVQWRLIPEGRRPNSCIINFFDEDEYSQPYFKPPHLDNPISTLVLSETTLAFGRVLASDPDGNYKGSLTLPLKEGSLLVMRGNSVDMARHIICPSDNRRVSITFVRVRPASNQVDPSAVPVQTTAMTLWQPGTPQPQKMLSRGAIAYGPQGIVPSWGLAALRAPLVMFSPSRPMAMAPGKRAARGGTGVFLPWTVGPKKYTKHLPPRIQKRRLPSLPSPIEAM